MPKPFELEQKFFDDNLGELLAHHEGKFALIVESNLVGVFDRQEDAYAFGVTKFGNVPLFIKKVQRSDPRASMPAMTLGLINAY